MAEDWSAAEVAATVADYVAMLGHELRRESYNKRDHNRQLQQQLNGRSAGAIEFKHCNISAVLIEMGIPAIDGYKPRYNYQQLLVDEVDAQLELHPEIPLLAKTAVEATIEHEPALRGLQDIIVDAPVRQRERTNVYDRPSRPVVPRRNVNYLEREAQNTSLGASGELFALELEHRRLWETGNRKLAERVEHVSRTQGDGLGYDISSFEADGRDRLIEVKTTAFGAMTPFFASRREVQVSEEQGSRFHLYRLFKFRETPKLFVLSGALRESCMLDPVQFRASLL